MAAENISFQISLHLIGFLRKKETADEEEKIEIRVGFHGGIKIGPLNEIQPQPPSATHPLSRNSFQSSQEPSNFPK